MSIARSIGRNVMWNAAGRFAILLAWFAATPAVLAALGPDRFGYWSLLLALGITLASVDLGLGIAVTREVARLAAQDDRPGLRRVVLGALGIQAGLGLVFLVGGLLLREPILAALRVPAPWLGEARTAFAIALGGFGILAGGNVFLATLQGLQRMDRAAGATLPLAVVLFAALLLAARAGTPLVAVTLVQLGHGLLVLVALGAQVFLLLRGSPASGRRAAAPDKVPLRRLLALGGWVQASALVALVHGQVDKVLFGTQVALAPVASYELGSRVVQAAVLLPLLFLGALLPAATSLEVQAGAGARLPLYRAALGPHALLSFGVVGALVGLAPAVLEAWLGTPPPDAAWMMRGLALSAGLSLAGGVASTFVRAAGPMRIEVTYAAIVSGLHVVLSWIGLAVLGLPGVVLGNVIATGVGVAWFLHAAEGWLGGTPLAESARADLPGLVAAALAAAGAAFVVAASAPLGGLAPGTGRGLLRLVAGGTAYVAVWTAVLAVLFPGSWRGLVTRVGAVVRP